MNKTLKCLLTVFQFNFACSSFYLPKTLFNLENCLKALVKLKAAVKIQTFLSLPLGKFNKTSVKKTSNSKEGKTEKREKRYIFLLS